MSEHFRDISIPFLIWVFANILGFSVLGIALLGFQSWIAISGLLGSTLIISIPISLAQWIALRRISPISILWILSIPISVLLIILIIREVPDGLWQLIDDEYPSGFSVGFFLFGFIIGLPQWLLFRPHYANSSIWLLGSSLGVALGSGLAIDTGLINQSTIASYIAAVLVYAITTGLFLSWLFATQDQSQSNLVSAT